MRRAVLAALLAVLAWRGAAAQAIAPSRHDSAAVAFRRGLMSLSSAGVPAFAAAHPTADGRGVLIAILDSGIDPGIPGLDSTTDGAPKVLDLRDFSGEGRISLSPVERRGDTLLVAGQRLVGAARVAAQAAGGAILGGVLDERRLGEAPAADLNGNNRVGDSLVVVVVRTPSGWALFADTQGNGTLADDRPVHDFAVARETFGWVAPDGLRPVDIAANFADSAGAPVLDLFFDTSSHGTHVAGIAAGHDLYAVPGFDGVAPGARLIGLKIANDAHGGVTVTGSMVRALDYAIRFAADRHMRLVVNLSFGVGNEIDGTARIDVLIDSILVRHPDVVMTVAAGNDGPALSTIGFPGSAARVISVGATIPPAFFGVPPGTSIAEPVAPFSSRGGEIAAPDLVVPGAAYSSVPNFAAGDEEETGTSMASPYAAGLAARLLSALPPDASPNATLIRQALRIAARRPPNASADDAGAGIPDLTAALTWLSGAHRLPELSIDIGAVIGRAGVLLTGDASSSRPMAAHVVVHRLDGTAPLLLHLHTDDPWITIPETIAVTGGRGEFTIAVAAGKATSTAVGSVRVDGPDAAAGPLAVIPVVLRNEMAVTGNNASTAAQVPPGGVARFFVSSDTGRGFQIEVASASATEHITGSLAEPGGMPFRGGAAISGGFGEGAGVFDVGAEDAVAGLYELDLVGSPLAPSAAKITVRPATLRLGAAFARDTLRVTARNLAAGTLSVRLRAGLIGAARQYHVSQAGDAPVRIAIPVPSWADRVVVDTHMPKEAWSRFTDFGVSFLDRHGLEFNASPINYAISRAEPELPDSVRGDTMVVLLSPGFADPSDRQPWTLDLDVRFYVQTPYSLDAGGSPFKPVAAGGIREERFTPGAMAIAFPAGFLPLITVVALEGPEQIWTREMTVPDAGP
ncbi:MAG: S8 family serine peptidase [Gemmatimonadales bacterium]